MRWKVDDTYGLLAGSRPTLGMETKFSGGLHLQTVDVLHFQKKIHGGPN